MKCPLNHGIHTFFRRRSPCGERGLKFRHINLYLLIISSLPVRGAWVEIVNPALVKSTVNVAPRAGSVG